MRWPRRGRAILFGDAGEPQLLGHPPLAEAALRFAERRRIGPFSAAAGDPRMREKAIAAMVRAGHSFALSRTIAGLAPGAAVDLEELRELNRR
jgi:hypothetical protein